MKSFNFNFNRRLCFISAVFIFSLFLGSLESCNMGMSGEGSATTGTIKKKKVKKSGCDIAILVYMAADNNLESSAIRDINEMEAADIPDNAVVLALLDRAEGFDKTNDDWTGTRLYKIKRDEKGNNSIIVSDRLACERLDLSLEKETELDMGNKNTLTGFLEFAKSTYNPKQTALIIWGHGNGWKCAGDFPVARETPVVGKVSVVGDFPSATKPPHSKAFSMDDTTGSFLTVSDLRQGIEASLGGEEKKLDFIGFDTCFGATIEVAYELKNCAKILAGSPGIVDTDGWNYTALFNSFFELPAIDRSEPSSEGSAGSEETENDQKTALSVQKFAECAIGEFYNQYESAFSASFITLDLEKMPEVYDSFNSWCDAVSKNINEIAVQTELQDLLFDEDNVVSYYSGSSQQSAKYDYYLNIFDMAEKTYDAFLNSEILFDNISYEESMKLSEATEKLKETLFDATIQSWSTDEDDFISLGVFFSLYIAKKTPYTSHPEEYVFGSKTSKQNLFVRNSNSWVPTNEKNHSLIDKIFYDTFD